MAFRARLNPISLVRRQAAAARLARRPLPFPTPLPAALASPGPSQNGYRQFSTSSIRPGFADFFRGRRSGATSNRDVLLASLSKGRLNAIADAYHSLEEEVLLVDDITAVLHAIVNNTTTKAQRLRTRIWGDMEAHGAQPSEETYRAMIVGCSNFGNVGEALRLVRALYDAGGSLGEDEWADIAFAAGSAKERSALVKEILDLATDVGQNTDRTDAALLEAIFANPDATEKEFSDISARMEADGVKRGLWVEMQVVALNVKRGDLDAAKAIVQTWPRPDNIEDPTLARELGRSLVTLEIARNNPDGVEAAVRSLPYGSDMSATTFVYLVQNRLSAVVQPGQAMQPEQLLQVTDDISRSTGRDPSASAWARLVSDILAQSDLNTALVIYQAARGRAPFMTADLARDLISKLCASRPPKFAEAMQVYDDLATTPSWEAMRSKDMSSSRKIFGTLLRACDRAEPPAPGIAMELADSAKARGVLLPTQDVTHYIVDTMGVSRDHPEAHEVYTHLVPLAAEPFTHRQYSHMLDKFILLDFPDSNVATPDFVISMLADMRRAGHEPSATIVTSLLKSYATLAKKVTRNKSKLSAADSEFAVDALTSATHDIYRLVSLDPMLEVDIPLLVSLMDALSSVNAFPDAMEVWNEIVRRRAEMTATLPADQVRTQYGPALSVVLDTCGYADMPERARRIWAWGRRHDLVNRRTWASYVECLSRVGQFDLALDVLVNEMGAQGLTATLAEVSLPVKFSWRHPRMISHVLERAQVSFPQYHDELKKIVQVKKKK